MESGKLKKILRPLSWGLLGLFLAVRASSAATVDHFTVLNPANNLPGSYNVDLAVTFMIAAQTAGNVTVPSFTGPVTVGLYDAVDPSILADPKAIITNLADSQSNTGTAVLNFVNGLLNIQVVFKTGYTGENLMLKHPTVTNGNTRGPYTITGFTTGYYLKDTNNASPPASSPPWDQLNIDPTVATGSDVIINVPYSANGTGSDNAAVYAITAVTGQFAAGNALLSANILTRGSGNPNIQYEIILDYNGDLNGNPNNYYQWDASDTVYTGFESNPASTTSFSAIASQPAHFTGTLPVSQMGGMVNGKVILRIWKNNNASVAQIRIRTASAGNACSIDIPYSNLNISPVRGTLTPKQVLTGGSVTMNYDINNLSGQAVTQTRFKIPAGGSVIPWTLQGTPTTRAGALVTYTNATTGADGYVDIYWNSVPLAVNEVASVAMTMSTAADVSQLNWDFGFITIKNSAGVTLPPDSAGAQDIQTLGAPSIVPGFTAVPSNYAASGPGNRADLSWTAVVDQGANGYVVQRRSPAGSGSFSPLTILSGSGTTSFQDTTAVNLVSYDYEIKAKNNVTTSSPVTSASVTPFTNPGIPTSLQALSGGTTVRLSWTAPSPGSYSLGGYQIFRSTTQGGVTTSAAVVTVVSSPFNDTGADIGSLSAGTTYFYRIAAIDNQPVTGTPGTGAHISGFNSTNALGYPPGNPPQNPAANFIPASSPNTILVSWTAPVSNLPASTPVSYLIKRGVNTGVTSSYAVTTAVLSFPDTAVVPGSFYVYQIAGLDSGGVTTNYSASVTGRVGPSAPTGLTAFPQAPSGSAITLTWAANPGGESVTNYAVYQDGVSINSTGLTTGTTILSGLAQGTDYIFQIQAKDNSGVTGPLSLPVTSALLPNVPASFAVTANSAVRSNVDMVWTAPTSSANVTGYNIYRNTTSSFSGSIPVSIGIPAAVAGTPVPSLDTGLSAGTTYFYFLKAQNPGGAGVSVMRGLQCPPNPPINLTTSSTAGAVSILWDARPVAEHVSLYKVYRIDLAGPTTVITNVSSPTTVLNDTTAVVGKSYDYFVTATNPGGGSGVAGGESLASGTVTSGRLPQAPTGFAVSGITTGNDISVTWTDVRTPVPNATSVDLLIGTVNNPASAVTTNLAASAVSFFDSGAGNTPDTTYYYWLKTNNIYGSGALAGPVSQLTYPAPVTITSLALNADGVSRDAVWTEPSSAVTYHIYRAQGASAFVKVQSVAASVLNFPTPLVLSLPIQPGQPYSYRVTAENSTGEGTYGNTFTINVPPSTPSGLTAISGISNLSTQIDLSWQAVSGQGVTGYHVYRSPDNVLGNYVSVGSTAGTSYSDLGLTGAVTYYYRVISDNSLKTALSLTSPVSLAAYALPNAPGPVTAISGDTQIPLAWGTTSLQTTYPIVGYDIYQSTSAGVTGTKINATPVPSASYPATGLTNGTPYYYFIQAVDSQGHAGIFSNPQASEIPVTTPGIPGNVARGNGNEAVLVTWSAATPGTLPVGYYLIQKVRVSGAVTTFIQVSGNLTGHLDSTGSGTNGESFIYSVAAIDSTGVTIGTHISAFSAPVTGVPGSNANPPGNVLVVGGINQATLTWTDSFTGAGFAVDNYELYRAQLPGAFGGTPVTSVGTGIQTIVNPGLTNGVTYGYYFIAYSLGTPSSHSATVFAVPGGPPAIPAGLTASDGTSRVTLNWTPNSPVDNIPVSLYNVHRDDGAGGSFSVIGATNHPIVNYFDTALSNGVTYRYYLTAVNNNNTEGSASTTIQAYPYDVGPPVGITSSSTNSAVTIIWNAPTTPVSSFPVIAYVMYRGTTPNPSFPMTVISAAGSPMTFIDSPVVPGQLYYYRIAANDDKGHIGSLSADILDGAANPPSPPSDLVANGGDGQILVDWSPVTVLASGSLPVSQYRITRTDIGGASTIVTSQTWYLDYPVSNGASVTYTVESIDVTGQISSGIHMSVPAGPVSATAASSNVNPPTGLTATALTNTSVRLDWTPANDQGRVIAHYVITRSSTFSGTYGTPVTVVNNFLSPPTTFNVTGLSPTQTYYFIMRSYDVTNNLASAPSNHAWATTPQGTGGALSPSGDMLLDRNLLRPLLSETLLIKYLVPTGGPVEIKIYTISGQPIMTLNPSAAVSGVEGNVTWDGRDKNGFMVASGLYLIEINIGSFHQVKKVAVVK